MPVIFAVRLEEGVLKTLPNALWKASEEHSKEGWEVIVLEGQETLLLVLLSEIRTTTFWRQIRDDS